MMDKIYKHRSAGLIENSSVRLISPVLRDKYRPNTSPNILSMEVDVYTQGPWNIPQKLSDQFSPERLKATLIALNQIRGRNYYFLDYRSKKIIVDSPSSPILCGYSRELLEKEGFEFYQRIMIKERDELWFSQMNREAYKIFFTTPKNERPYLVHSYDLWVESVHGQKEIMHHKVVPYSLCKNGNLWLGLCYMTVSSSPESGHPTIINNSTGDRYDFLDSVFVRSVKPSLTSEELSIIEWLAKGLSAQEMRVRIKVSLPTFKRKKLILCQKAGVRTSAELVHWAHLSGII